MAVNVRRMAARAMVGKGVKGSIVCTPSVVAESGSKVNTDYSMSKHAVLGLVRSASMQLAARGVRVNCVSPGMVGTQTVAETFKIGAEEMKEMLAAVYKGRDGPLMEKHVADAVAFLASEDSAFVTGHNLVVDGGVGTSMNIISASKAN
uniref:short-chain dehydrogenase reductase 3b-like n=1 Tax=Fragaria vesca subsp. vesca TaxID=101020 RepID=UPI0005C92E50|nr:PREDICTED: short-chain dehydrogenase reductase 3b-like [Fragaria vesca subsp. vesca]